MNTTRTLNRSAIVATALLALVLAGCSSSDGPAAGGDEGIVIGHSYQNLDNQFFADELAAERALGETEGVTIIDTQASDNPATQLDNVNTLIARGVDVLVIDAVDPDAIVPALDAAEQAGIPVISLIAEPSGGTYASLVYLDSTKDGFNACTDLAEAMGGEGTMVNLTGPMQILAAKQRAEGCNQALEAYPDITKVAEINTDYSLRDAEQKMTDAIQAHGEVDAVFGGNDDIALGAIRAMASAGQDVTTKTIIGVDGTEAALNAICSGEMTETFATFPAAEARIVIDTAKAILSGGSFEKSVLFPAVPVNKDNLAEMAEQAGVTLENCAS